MEERPECVRKRRVGRKIVRILTYVFLGIILAALFALVFGFVLKWLWNWLMPGIFGLPEISYWQAFGLLVLSKLLFGRFSHHDRDRHDHGFKKSFFRRREDRLSRHRRPDDFGHGPEEGDARENAPGTA